MGPPPAGIPDAVWLSWPAEAREFTLDQQGEPRAQQEEVEQLRAQLTALATEVASPRERNGRSSRNSCKPHSSDGPRPPLRGSPSGYRPPERRKGSGRERGGQPGYPGAGPELLSIERVNEVVEQPP